MKPLALVVFFAYWLCCTCHSFLSEFQLSRATLVTKTTLAAPLSILPDAPVSMDRYPEPRPSVEYKDVSLVGRVPQPGPICRRDCI